MEIIKDFFINAFSSRIRVVMVAMVFFATVLVSRLFYLQIINGSEYQDNYNLKLEKTESIPATRGNIYDRNGNLLAYNELVYAVTIQDNGTYSSKTEKSESLNTEIAQIISKLEGNGDKIDNDFGIYIDSSGNYQFLYTSDTLIQRFRADVFGKANIDDLAYNEKLGFDVVPNATEDRFDIIQAVTFGKPVGVIAFCEGVQAAAPVDSFVAPEPWDMPGYDAQVIMAAGAFISGSSIELSADGPIKEPYSVFFQGGLTWPHAKLGILKTLQKLVDRGLIVIQ